MNVVTGPSFTTLTDIVPPVTRILFLIEIDPGNLPFRCISFELSFGLKSKEVRKHHTWKVSASNVVVRNFLIIVAARHSDSVLGALELYHQILELLIRLQIRVGFGNRKEPAQTIIDLS